MGIAGLLIICGVYLWWRRRRTTFEEPRGTGGGMRLQRQGTSAPPTEGDVKEEDKLPKGVFGAQSPQETTEPVELPAEVSGESGDERMRSNAPQERLELCGMVENTNLRVESVRRVGDTNR